MLFFTAAPRQIDRQLMLVRAEKDRIEALSPVSRSIRSPVCDDDAPVRTQRTPRTLLSTIAAALPAVALSEPIALGGNERRKLAVERHRRVRVWSTSRFAPNDA